MKQIIYSLLLTLITSLCGCSNKADCPLCDATGEIDSNQGRITCFVCQGEGKLAKEDAAKISVYLQMYRSGVQRANQPSQGNNDHNSDDIVCPVCQGGMRATNGNPCYFCNGVGSVSRDMATQMQYIINGGSTADIYGSPSANSNNNGSGSRSNSGTLCGFCGGSGACPVCKGLGETSYYGSSPLPCKTCYATGECPRCDHGIVH